VALSPVRFFSAGAANLLLISLIAPAREGAHVWPPVHAAVGVSGSCPRSTARQQRPSLLSSVSPKRHDAVKTQREKAEEERQVKLDLVREQVQNGTLVIRQMTEEERRRYPAPTTPPNRPRSRD
jgi:hypothetical protein